MISPDAWWGEEQESQGRQDLGRYNQRQRNGNVSDLMSHGFTRTIESFLTLIVSQAPFFIPTESTGTRVLRIENKHDIAHHHLIMLDNQWEIGREYHIQNVNGYISRLKEWMNHFYGVGARLTSRLSGVGYLREKLSVPSWLKAALGLNQQLMSI